MSQGTLLYPINRSNIIMTETVSAVLLCRASRGLLHINICLPMDLSELFAVKRSQKFLGSVLSGHKALRQGECGMAAYVTAERASTLFSWPSRSGV